MNQKHLQLLSSTSFRMMALALLAALILAPLTATAQRLPADMELQAFDPSSDYEIKVDGATPAKVQLYFSQRAAAYLIMKAFSAPVLVRQRGGSVESVHIMKVAKQGNGSIDLLQGAVLANLGRYQFTGQNIEFTVDGKKVQMVPRPPLVGLHDAEEVLEHSPEYGVKAATYTPTPATLSSLRSQGKDVKVKVFFGSWCSVCSRYLPYGLKVEEGLDDSKVSFEYYGLSMPPEGWKDPVVTKAKVTGVPTAIVTVNGREAGRITGNGWARPEETLARIVKEAS